MNLIMAMAIAILSGQPAPIDPPLVNRPDAFSNVVGKYNLRVTAAPTDVRVEEPILLRVTITGDGAAKYEPHLTLDGSRLTYRRSMAVATRGVLYSAPYYQNFREFFEAVHRLDAQSVVVRKKDAR